MKKIILVVIVGTLLVSCKSKDIKGVWMYTNERSLKYEDEWTEDMSGFVFDFDNNKSKILLLDTVFDTRFKFRKKLTLKFLGTIEKLSYKIIQNNIIVIESEKDEVKVFKLLDLNHKLNSSKEEIIDFLVNAELPQIAENGLYDSEGNLGRYLELDFMKDIYKYGTSKSLKTLKSNYFKKDNDVGYWYVGEVQNNFFLFFNGQLGFDTNTYQILSLSTTSMKLKPLYESDISGITELKAK